MTDARERFDVDAARLQRLGIDPAQVTVDHDDLAVRVVKVMEMEAPEDEFCPYRRGYEDALADVRATLQGEL